jgi:hypothetical protein
LIATVPTTETQTPALKFSNSVAVNHLYFQILLLHPASVDSRNIRLGCVLSGVSQKTEHQQP